jgi:hypothetical protein
MASTFFMVERVWFERKTCPVFGEKAEPFEQKSGRNHEFGSLPTQKQYFCHMKR